MGAHHPKRLLGTRSTPNKPTDVQDALKTRNSLVFKTALLWATRSFLLSCKLLIPIQNQIINEIIPRSKSPGNTPTASQTSIPALRSLLSYSRSIPSSSSLGQQCSALWTILRSPSTAPWKPVETIPQVETVDIKARVPKPNRKLSCWVN